MKELITDKTTLYIPEKSDIINLKVGDLALDCFGNFKIVTSITYRGIDNKENNYVGYYTEFGPNGSTISNSMKENEIQLTVSACRFYTSDQLREFERKMQNVR